MTAGSGVNLEDIIKSIGGCGRFQITLSVIVHSMKCIVCFTMVAMVFGAAVPDWWCIDETIGQNASDVIESHNSSQYESCSLVNETKSCSKFHYDDTMRTVVTEVRIIKLKYLKLRFLVFKHENHSSLELNISKLLQTS